MNKNSLDKKGLVVAAILLFISVSVIPSTATMVEKKSTMLTSFYDGDTLYVGGSGPGNYSNIQDAIDDASDGEKYFEDVDVLIIGRCHTRMHDGKWSDRFLYIGNLTIAGLGIGNTSLQRIYVIVYNKTFLNLYDSFIRFTNGMVLMRNASGIFFWGAAKSGVRFISPVVFIRCHTDRLWIRNRGIL